MARSRCRSCDTSTSVPSNCASATASASRVSRSRWLVGSSSSSRFGRCQTISASASRAFSPPEKCSIGLGRHVAGKVEAAEVVAQLLLARDRLSEMRLQVPERRLVVAQHLDLVLGEVADHQALVERHGCPPAAASTPAMVLMQRRLAGAVDAEQADALARAQRQVHVRTAPPCRRSRRRRLPAPAADRARAAARGTRTRTARRRAAARGPPSSPASSCGSAPGAPWSPWRGSGR